MMYICNVCIYFSTKCFAHVRLSMMIIMYVFCVDTFEDVNHIFN